MVSSSGLIAYFLLPMDTGGAREAVAQWTVVQSRKRPGVLSCAVREVGIPSSVCARILTETNSGLYI